MLRTFVIVLLVALAGCPEQHTTPTCAELGCGSAALCNRHGECTCHEQACELAPVDGGTP